MTAPVVLDVRVRDRGANAALKALLATLREFSVQQQKNADLATRTALASARAAEALSGSTKKVAQSLSGMKADAERSTESVRKTGQAIEGTAKQAAAAGAPVEALGRKLKGTAKAADETTAAMRKTGDAVKNAIALVNGLMSTFKNTTGLEAKRLINTSGLQEEAKRAAIDSVEAMESLLNDRLKAIATRASKGLWSEEKFMAAAREAIKKATAEIEALTKTLPPAVVKIVPTVQGAPGAGAAQGPSGTDDEIAKAKQLEQAFQLVGDRVRGLSGDLAKLGTGEFVAGLDQIEKELTEASLQFKATSDDAKVFAQVILRIQNLRSAVRNLGADPQAVQQFVQMGLLTQEMVDNMLAFTPATQQAEVSATELARQLKVAQLQLDAGFISAEKFNETLKSIQDEALRQVADAARKDTQELNALNAVINQTRGLSVDVFGQILNRVNALEAELAAGKIGVEQYTAEIAQLREQAIAAADAIGTLSDRQLSRLNTILDKTNPKAGFTADQLRRMRTGVLGVIQAMIGMSGALGQLGTTLTAFLPLTAKFIGVAAAIAAVAAAYRFLTTAQREQREQDKETLKRLQQEAQQARPALVKAIEDQVRAGREEERLRKRVADLRAAPLGARTGINPFATEVLRQAEEELAKAQEGTAKATANKRQAEQDYFRTYVTSVEKQIELEGLNNKTRADAVALIKELRDQQQRPGVTIPERQELEESARRLQATLDRNPVADARRAAQEQADQNLLTQQKALNQNLLEMNEQAYQRGTQDLAAFYAKRREIIEENAKNEDEALRRQAARVAQRQITATDAREREAEVVKKAQDLANIQAQRDDLAVRKARELRAIGAEEEQARKQFFEERLRMDQQILELEGKTSEAALTGINAQVAGYRELLAQQEGLTDAQRDAEAQRFRDLLTQQAMLQLEEQRLDVMEQHAQATGRFSEATKLAVDREIAAYKELLRTTQGITEEQKKRMLAEFTIAKNLQRDAVQTERRFSAEQFELGKAIQDQQNQFAQGLIGREQMEQRIADIIKARLPALRAEADTMSKIAARTGDEGMVEKAAQLQQQLIELELQADRTGQRITTVIGGAVDTIAEGFSSFANDVISNNANIGESFGNMARQTVAAINAMIIRMLVAIAVQRLLFGAASSSIPPAPGGLTSEALSQQVAAAPTFAEGGRIHGQGTEKSDSNLIRASVDEYVLNARAAKALGYDWLDEVNRRYSDSRLTPPRMRSTPRYADGGLVSATMGAREGVDIHGEITVAVDETGLLRVLKGKLGQEITVRHVAARPTDISRMLRTGGPHRG